MPQLTFPVTQAGLSLPVWIGLDGKTTSALVSAGQSLVSPMQVRGLIDSGSNVTAVAPVVLQQLGVLVATTTITHTPAGQVKVNLYEISLSITDPNQPGSPWLTQSNLLVMGLPAILPDADVLVGLDILLNCKMLLDGPARQFFLEF